MPLVKDVLWTGRWEYPEEVLTLGDRDVRQAVLNGNCMIGKGSAVKLCWEHQPNVVPKPASQWARELADPNNAATFAKSVIADATQFRMARGDGGKPIVQAIIDDSKLSASERQQIERAGKVSCRLDRNFRDPATGTLYPGWSISHIAVTPKPVQAKQGPFVQMSRSDWPSERTVFMGEGKPMADENDDKPKKKEPPTDDAQPKDGDGDGEVNEGEEGDAGGEAIPSSPQGPTGNRAKLMRLMAVMNAGWGINIPETVMDFDSLILALETLAANPTEQPNDAALDPLDPNATTAAPGAGGSGMPMMMSSLELAKSHPRKVQNDRDELKGDIKALVRSGQIPAYVGQEWLEKVDAKTFTMSYVKGDNSLVRDGLIAAVDAIRENVIKGTFLSRKGTKQMSGLGRTTEVAPPKQFATDTNTPTDLSAEMRKIAEARNRPNVTS